MFCFPNQNFWRSANRKKTHTAKEAYFLYSFRFKEELRRWGKTKNSTMEWNYHMLQMVPKELSSPRSGIFGRCFSDCSQSATRRHWRNVSQFQCRRVGAGVVGPPPATGRSLRQWHGAHSWQETSRLNRVKSPTGIFGGGAMIISSVETNAQDAHDSPADCQELKNFSW